MRSNSTRDSEPHVVPPFHTANHLRTRRAVAPPVDLYYGGPDVNRPVEELRPDQVLALVATSGIALIPVSPMVEWHSFHLPLGVDGLLVEAIARTLSERLGAAWFRPLPIGLDAFRDEPFKQAQGLDLNTPVFGMNYPTLPLQSEYVGADVLHAMITARIRVTLAAGFRHVFIINHHGGEGQMDTLRHACASLAAPGIHLEVLHTVAFQTRPSNQVAARALSVGGHAGLAETIQFMAFHEELIALDRLPSGPLRAANVGILHDAPVIPDTAHPCHADPALARAWGSALLDNMEQHIRTVCEKKRIPS